MRVLSAPFAAILALGVVGCPALLSDDFNVRTPSDASRSIDDAAADALASVSNDGDGVGDIRDAAAASDAGDDGVQTSDASDEPRGSPDAGRDAGEAGEPTPTPGQPCSPVGIFQCVGQEQFYCANEGWNTEVVCNGDAGQSCVTDTRSCVCPVNLVLCGSECLPAGSMCGLGNLP